MDGAAGAAGAAAAAASDRYSAEVCKVEDGELGVVGGWAGNRVHCFSPLGLCGRRDKQSNTQCTYR